MLRILTKSGKYLLKWKPCLNYLPSQLFSISPSVVSDLRVQKYSALLSNYGFKPGQIDRIFKSPHSILTLEKGELLLNLTNWLHFDVKEKLFNALSSYPELLTLNPDFVNNRVKELMTLFTKKDINKLLVTCPNVFLNEFSDTYEKVQYIVIRMGVGQKSIVKCCALHFDLHHIKCRHHFITLAGYYKINKRATKCTNPPLDKIFSRNMDTFLKLTNLTEEEYEVFSEHFVDELDYLDEEEESDDEL